MALTNKLCFILLLWMVLFSSYSYGESSSNGYTFLDRIPLINYIINHRMVTGDVDIDWDDKIFSNKVEIKFLAFYAPINLFDVPLISKFEFRTELGSDDTLSGDIDSYKLSVKCIIRTDLKID